ncbi:MAG: WG repeat-containing protein [Bacteroidota bacterium]
MKNLVILIISLIIHSFGYTQVIKNIDKISPFNEELSAIKKGEQWAFINEKGVMVIDFRDDLFCSKDETEINTDTYPVFKDGRCLIRKLNNGVYHYGYIDKNGKEIIACQYLNASNFKDGYAIIIDIEKKIIGFNKVLGKDVVSYNLKEYIIDTSGKKIKYLDNARGYTKPKGKTIKPPSFYSKFIAPHLIAVKNIEEQKWDIYEF